MRVRYQQGYLRLGHRKNGPDCWEFLWWDSEPTGKRVRRKAAIGTILKYPNEVQIFTAFSERSQHFIYADPEWRPIGPAISVPGPPA
jgi:hypothetical protein